MFDTGRLCMKLAGRDAGSFCVVVNEKDGKVLVDGQTRRRYVNPNHLEPLKKTADVKKDASHDEVVKALKALNIEVKVSTWTKPVKAKKETKPKKEEKKESSEKPAKKAEPESKK